jgi:hypothetical protein
MKDKLNNVKDCALTGAAIGLIIPGIGSEIGAILGGIFGLFA